MNNNGALSMFPRGERELIITRDFNAPRELVFDAHTKPELLRRWFGVFAGMEMIVCEVDLTVGGKYHYIWRSPDGSQMGMHGVYQEIMRPERLVVLTEFDESWYPGDELETMVLTEQDGRTTLTNTVQYRSQEARDIVLGSDAEMGVAAGYANLDKLLESLAAGVE